MTATIIQLPQATVTMATDILEACSTLSGLKCIKYQNIT